MNVSERSPIRWLKLLNSILKLSSIAGVPLGAIAGLISSPKQDLIQTLFYLVFAIGEMVLLIFTYSILCILLTLILSRFIRNLRGIVFVVNGLLLTPLFLFWVYRINVAGLPRFLSAKSIAWNLIFAIVFGILWFVVSRFYFSWIQSSVADTEPFRRSKVSVPVGIIFILAIILYQVQPVLTGETMEQPLSKSMEGATAANFQTPRSSHLPVYLFDEMLGEAVVTEASAADFDLSPVSFNFDNTDAAKWEATDKTRISISEKKSSLGISMTNMSSIEIRNLKAPAEDVFAIFLRMKVSRGSYYELSWKRTTDADFDFKRKTRIRIPANNEFIDYKIRALGFWEWNGVIEALRLTPSDSAPAEIELDYLHFVTGHQYFSGKIGTEDHKVKSEARKVIYVHSPSTIRYKIAVPHGAFLTFGTAIIDTKAPTNFEVTVEEEGKPPENVHANRVEVEKWQDQEIDLSKWGGKEVTVSFRTSSSQKAAVAFWSNPVLYGASSDRPPNVLIYLIDCFRADHAGVYGYERNTTPNLNAFAKEGVLFLNHYAQFTATRASVSSLFTSQYYSAHRVHHQMRSGHPSRSPTRLSDHFKTIAEELREHGYNTISFLENPQAGPDANLDQGFERIFLNGLNHQGDRYGEISEFRNWINTDLSRKRNFFLYVHTMELHDPYEPPEPYYSMFAPHLKEKVREDYTLYRRQTNTFMVPKSKRDEIVAVYDGAIHLADKRFGEVVQALKKAGLYDETLIIVTADHGELFDEHELWTHGGRPYEGVIKIPLLMRYPRFVAKQKVVAAGNVQSIDIAPTILDVLNIPPNSQYQGMSLYPLIQNRNVDLFKKRSVYSEGLDRMALKANRFQYSERIASIQGSWKYMLNREEMNRSDAFAIGRLIPLCFPLVSDFFRISRHELYDLKSDEEEKHNLTAVERSRLSAQKKELIRWLRIQDKVFREKIDLSKKEESIIDPQVQEELKALGYVQ